MRVSGRLLGLGGFGFIGLGFLLLGTKASWLVALVPLAIGYGLLFVSHHYFLREARKIPSVQTQRRPLVPRRFVPFVAAHRRELSVLAQIGLALSLFRLVGLFFGSKWPGFWGTWLLGVSSMALLIVCPKWFGSLPKWPGWVLRAWSNASLVLFCSLVTTYFTHQAWPGLDQYRSILVTALLMLLYGRAAVGFARGEIQSLNVGSG